MVLDPTFSGKDVKLWKFLLLAERVSDRFGSSNGDLYRLATFASCSREQKISFISRLIVF